MKKLIICALLALISAAIFQSCSYLPPNKEEVKTMVQNYTDSIISGQESLLNPMFSTPEDVLIYREMFNEQMALDSIFFRLSDKDIENVASVTIKKLGYATKKAIVEEYNKNSDVYSKLPDTQPTTNDKTTSSMEDSGVTKDKKSTIILSTDYQYITDTIDGVPRKVMIKTEKSYEK